MALHWPAMDSDEAPGLPTLPVVGQRRAAGFADVAGDEVEVVDRHHAVRAVRGLVDAHGPDGHGRTGLGVDARHVANGVFVDATDFRRRDRIVLLDPRLEFLEALGVRGYVVRLIRAFLP